MGRPRCAPGDEVGVELGADGVEKLGAGGDAFLGDLEEEAAGDGEAGVDVVGLVEVGVVDEPFHPTVVRGFSK